MAKQVCTGAILQCSMGTTPSQLAVVPPHDVQTEHQEAANIGDNVPNVEVMPFGACISLANPQVTAATSAALGVLTPQPCIPVLPARWTPGAIPVLIGGQPTLDSSSTLMCTWGGVITITFPGQVTVDVP